MLSPNPQIFCAEQESMAVQQKWLQTKHFYKSGMCTMCFIATMGRVVYHVFYCHFRQSVMSNLRQIFETQTMSRSVDQLGWDTSYLMCGQIRKWKSSFPFDGLMIMNFYHKKGFLGVLCGGTNRQFSEPEIEKWPFFVKYSVGGGI